MRAGLEHERLREAAQQAVAPFGFDAHEVELVSHYVNTVFRLTTESGDYAVRIHRARGRGTTQVAGEVAWLDALAGEADIRVPGVRRTLDGKAVVSVSIPEKGRTFPVTVVDWLPGQPIGGQKGSHHFEELGRMTAVLHRHARTWRLPVGFDRPTYDRRSVFGEVVPDRIAEVVGAVSGKVVNEALAALERQLQEVQEVLGTGTDVFGLVHGDLSFGNVLFDGERASPIDFDDCGFGYYLHDLAVPLAGAFGSQGFAERYHAFLRGYRQVSPLPCDLLVHVPVFVGLRSAQLILDYAGTVPWPEGILGQLKTRLQPALDASRSPNEWVR